MPLSSLSIRADSVELPSSKVSASNEAINKSTALTGLSTLFVRDDHDVHDHDDNDDDDDVRRDLQLPAIAG